MSILRSALNLMAFGIAAAPLAVAASALGGVGHRWPDLLAQFTAPALFAALALTVVLAPARLWPATGAAGLAVVLLAVAVWPQWFPDRGEAAPDAPSLSLYSANLWAWNTEVEAIAASIAEADADVVVLIELGDAPADRLDRIVGVYPHRVLTPRVGRPSGAARSLIASRFPLSEIPDRPDGLHTVAAVAETPLGPVNIVGVHLTRPWPFQYQWGQITQVEALAAIRRDLTGPVIVAGDFNAVSGARIGKQVRAETGLIPAPGRPGTWPSRIPSFAAITIDHVWRSPDLALRERRLGRPMGSDHRPVVTRFSRANAPS